MIFPSVSFLRNKNRYQYSTARSVIAAAAFFFLINLAQAQGVNPLASDPRAAQAGGAIFGLNAQPVMVLMRRVSIVSRRRTSR